MSGLLMSHREKISCMWHFQTVVLKTVLLRVVVSIYVMKIYTKESKRGNQNTIFWIDFSLIIIFNHKYNYGFCKSSPSDISQFCISVQRVTINTVVKLFTKQVK